MKFYVIADDKKTELIGQKIEGALDGTRTLSQSGSEAEKIKLRIESKVGSYDKFYFFDDLKVKLSSN